MRRIGAIVSFLRELSHWVSSGFASPAPNFVKRRVLLRIAEPQATWIETGTLVGATTEFLARRGFAVVSIEPSSHFFKIASSRLANFPRVELLHGSSETELERALSQIEGDVCFWLDGHHSGGNTFLGSAVTPIEYELSVIAKKLPELRRVVLAVDDVRLFTTPNYNGEAGYPSLASLVRFAESHDFSWVIEHDIFIARRRNISA